MLTPELVEEFIRAFAEEMAIHQREAAGHRTQLEHTLAGVERRRKGVLRAIEDGAWNESLRIRLTDLETSKTDLTARLANLATPARIVLHPNAASLYAAKVADLETALTAPAVQAEAGDALRALIERVVLRPDAGAEDGLAAELHGDLAMILELAAAAGGAPDQLRRQGRRADNKNLPGTCVLASQLSVVAGTCNHFYRTHGRFRSYPTEREGREIIAITALSSAKSPDSASPARR
jgi:hypothetical protein